MKQTMPINGAFQLIELPYAKNALEPTISEKTLDFHHGKHLQTYVDNLNALLAGKQYGGKSLEEIVRDSDGGVLNNAGQILNHNLYFTQFTPAGNGSAPSGRLAEAIQAEFGSVDAFKEAFQKQGVTLFGSGWVWLSSDSKGKLHITQEANAGNPIRRGLCPLLTFDVWEHAYYLDYQNRRAAHLAALWDIIDWKVIEQRYAQIVQCGCEHWQ